jgi:DivIVA domain-containing protein
MPTQPTPDEIRRATFRVVFRGYDQAEVESRLSELAAAVEDLVEQRDRMASRLGEFADRDLKSEFETVGREVTSVLEAARSAAQTMRDRATADAARWRSEAMAEVEALRKEARGDAEGLRSDAWTTGGQLLEQVMAEVERIRTAAERDSLAVRGEAEREAHRLTSSARREAEELVRTAKMEAERLVAQAQADHDDIVATAHRQAEAAQERTRALEQRREELMGELESLRSTLASFESELEDRRQGIGLSEPTELPHRAVVSDEAGVHVADWEEGHTVRVIRPSREDETEPKEEVEEETDGEQVAAEVARMRQDQVVEGVRVIPAGEESEAGPADDEGEVETEPIGEESGFEQGESEEAEVPEEHETEGVAETPGQAKEAGEVGSEPDDVLELFRRLRHPDDEQPHEESPPAEEAEETEEPEEGDVAVEEAAEAEPETGGGPDADEGVDPFEIRDRLLLPITNEALRAVKRALTDAQNRALEQIRVNAGEWRPDEAELEELVHDDLVALSEEAALAGAEAATELGVSGVSLPEGPEPVEPPALGHDLARALTAAVEGAGSGARERQAAASRVFRGWRTDEAERRLRLLAHSAYHHTLRAVLDQHERQWKWQAAGRLCATCRAAAEAGELPPAHRDCNCTIVPV